MSTRQERRRWQEFRERHGVTLADFKRKWVAMFERLPTDDECDDFEEKKRELRAPLGRKRRMSIDRMKEEDPVERDITVTLKHEWDMGHRLPEHDGKCRKLHGHRYVAEVDVTGKVQMFGASSGMVVDFSVIKKQLVDTVDKYWDHKTMLRMDDPIVIDCVDESQCAEFGIHTVPWTPTAENIALELFEWLENLNRGSNINITRVRIYETPNGWAEVRA